MIDGILYSIVFVYINIYSMAPYGSQMIIGCRISHKNTKHTEKYNRLYRQILIPKYSKDVAYL
jgi:hypothetical protein